MYVIHPRIIKKTKITADITEVAFSLEAEHFTFLPGQYVRVTIPELLYPDRRNFRDFSITSSPDEAQELRIIIRNSNSGFKRTLLESPVGTRIQLTGPFGNFLLPDTSDRSLICIAGGIGITPFLSMLAHTTTRSLPHDILILYATQKEEKELFANMLAAHRRKNAQIEIVRVQGDIKAPDIETRVQQKKMPLWYVSGPPRMVDSVNKILRKIGVSDTDIRTEIFLGYDMEVPAAPRQKQSENELREARNSALIQALDRTAIVSVTDMDGNIIFANDKLVEISQYTRDELIGQNHRLLKSDHHSPDFFKKLWNGVLSGNVWRGEIKNRAKDGTFYWVDSSIAPIFNDGGKITHFIAVRFPITDKKILEERLHQSEKRFRELFDLAPEGIFVANIDGTYTDVNKAGCVLLGRSRENIIGKTIIDLIQKDDIPRLWEQRKLMQTGAIITDEWCLRKLDGSLVQVEVSSAILSDGRWLGFVRDISDRKKAEAELQRLRQEWVMIVAHDLRQPVQRIALASELLRHTEKNISPNGLAELADIDASILGLSRLTEDLFDAARLDSKQVVISLRKTDMLPLLERMAKRFQQSTGRNVTVSAHGIEQFSVLVDTQRIEQVLSNLLSNAVKYSTPELPIEADLSFDDNVVTCAISNYGRGLTEEEQKNLFLRFYRVPGSEKKAKGSGLGLYISKGLIEAQGGRMWATSAPGQKTTFSFSIPKYKE